MPLLDGPGSNDTAIDSVQYGVSQAANVQSGFNAQNFQHSMSERQRIVVVGLGMVAISFMWVSFRVKLGLCPRQLC